MTRLDSGKVSEALAHVERELNALWAPAEGEPPRSRVCTGNLVVLASHEGRERAVALLDALGAADAARTFLVAVDPRLPLWAVETSVTARCRRDNDQLLCAERIDLSLGASTVARAPSLLAALAMAEVPTTLVLLEPPPPALLGPLLRDATRLVVDSDALGLELTRRLAGSTAAQLVDLAWWRLLPWRNQLASAFDPLPLRPAVSAVRRVAITTTPLASGALAPAARLLLGWLASRLGWRLRSATEATDALLHPVALEISTSPDLSLPPGQLLAIELSAQLGDAQMTVELARDGATLQAVRSAEGHDTLSERIALEVLSLPALVDRALADPLPDAVLRQTLAASPPEPPASPPEPPPSPLEPPPSPLEQPPSPRPPGATLVISTDTLVAADGDALAHLAAHLVRAWLAEAVAARGVARLAVSGGSTPRAMMRLLAGLPLPWSATGWFWVDERFVPADHPRSNYGAARVDLFDRLVSPPGAVHPMPGTGSLDEGADAYEMTLARSFGLPRPHDDGTAPPCFDLVLLGVGDDGHTASLFPGEDAVERSDRWVLPIPAAGEREARLSLSRPVLTSARRVVVLAQGASKREPLRLARSAGPLRDIPSRLTHEVKGELLWLLDAAAASPA